MSYVKQWSDAKKEYEKKYKVAVKSVAKLKSELKKVKRAVKKGKDDLDESDIADIQKQIDNIDKIQKTKTGLTPAFTKIEKTMDVGVVLRQKNIDKNHEAWGKWIEQIKKDMAAIKKAYDKLEALGNSAKSCTTSIKNYGGGKSVEVNSVANSADFDILVKAADGIRVQVSNDFETKFHSYLRGRGA